MNATPSRIKKSVLLLLPLLLGLPAFAQQPDAVEEVRQQLEQQRHLVVNSDILSSAEKAQQLLELGAWEEAANLIAAAEPSLARTLAQARLAFLQHAYGQAEELVNAVLQEEPRNREALLLKSKLQVQAWDLAEAEATAKRLLANNERDEAAALAIGRILMLQKDYAQALEWARKVQRWNPNSAGAWLLESDVHFWNQQPELAEGPLVKSLTLDPFNADARFNYGYAIWRRVDATQLDAMADQWELALTINPLHYVTHWHWGNGHTNLTYADYAQPEDEAVREALQVVDTLISKNSIQQALEVAREVQQKYPTSVLPAMFRGSAYYMAFEMDRTQRLDSAHTIFRRILEQKNHYGPAHNGLAAVIKQKQLSYLADYDSLNQVIRQTEIKDPENFGRVFPDVQYYPGKEVQQMVWAQLYESIVYFPFLARQEEKFVIPPLHIDLTIAMGSPYFRGGTTFDNRQWMDIRGVGSGAAGIEYVVRGAYLERNVVLHEYVHQFHGRVFTDEENREVRRLYHKAMQEGRTLDYYSANNEHEYLAQTYPAYFEPEKVHPLNHKSVNTTSELKAKDPELYSFLDGLVKRQRAYLAGDEQAMASNWAQVYINLSDEARREKRYAEAAALLDTALQWDNAYQPALISYAMLNWEEQNFQAAQDWLEKAKAVDADYAPVYVAEASLLEAMRQAGEIPQEAAITRQESLYRQAMALEDDLLMRAYTNQQFREFYVSYGKIPEAIAVAEQYLEDAPTISTYLRDRRDEAIAFASWLKGVSSENTEAEEELARLVSRKPQHYNLRRQYAEVLASQGKYDQAHQVLAEGQRILSAAGNPRADYMVRMAAYQLATGDSLAARTSIQPLLEGSINLQEKELLAGVLLGLGETAQAADILKNLPSPKTPQEAANRWLAKAQLLEAQGKTKKAAKAYEAALKEDAYHRQARALYLQLLQRQGKEKKARQLKQEGARLKKTFIP